MACTIDCGQSVRVKACGGLGPYTWSKTGSVTLSSTSGSAITVTSTEAPGGGGASLHKVAFISYAFRGWRVDDPTGCGPGVPFGVAASGGTGWARQYNCRGDLICETNGACDPEFIPPDCSAVQTVCQNQTMCPPFDTCDLAAVISCCNPAGDLTLDMTINPTGAGCAGATIFESMEVPDGTGALFAPVTIGWSSQADVRTADDIADGCDCNQGTTTITVVDAVGASSTVVLHA